jgi:hypothetical protein
VTIAGKQLRDYDIPRPERAPFLSSASSVQME